MQHITTSPKWEGKLLESGTIVVTGLQRTHFNLCSVAVVPEGQEGRQVHGGPLVPGPWGFVTPHALVIDNHGGSKREADEAPYRIAVGEEFTVEGLPGVWTLRSPRRFEGDGAKLEHVEG